MQWKAVNTKSGQNAKNKGLLSVQPKQDIHLTYSTAQRMVEKGSRKKGQLGGGEKSYEMLSWRHDMALAIMDSEQVQLPAHGLLGLSTISHTDGGGVPGALVLPEELLAT